jgi:hypothetical protein
MIQGFLFGLGLIAAFVVVTNIVQIATALAVLIGIVVSIAFLVWTGPSGWVSALIAAVAWVVIEYHKKAQAALSPEERWKRVQAPDLAMERVHRFMFANSRRILFCGLVVVSTYITYVLIFRFVHGTL